MMIDDDIFSLGFDEESLRYFISKTSLSRFLDNKHRYNPRVSNASLIRTVENKTSIKLTIELKTHKLIRTIQISKQSLRDYKIEKILK